VTATLEHWPERAAISADDRFYVGIAGLDVTLVMPYDLAKGPSRSRPMASLASGDEHGQIRVWPLVPR
jgi:hypothetical protein